MAKTVTNLEGLLTVAQGSSTEQISVIHRGLRSSLFTKMAKHIGMSQKRLAPTLRLNERTLRNRSAQQHLTQEESEKLLRVARVYARAKQVLGNDARARSWIDASIESLGGNRPIDLLETDIGTQEVLNTLLAIEWGVYL